jgi:lipopolysaccharide export system permease protein
VALLEHLPGDIRLGITAAEFHLGRGELKNLDLLVSHRQRPCILIHADRAIWQKEEWRLVHGQIWFDLNRDTGSSPPGRAQKLEVTLGRRRIQWRKTPAEIAREIAAPWELTALEMRQRIADKKARGADWRREIAPDLVELHNKYALPWTGFLFALLGAPLGIRPRRTSKGLAYGICLAIIFAYFALWHTLVLFGKSGGIPPALAPWAPNLVLAAVGAFLLRQAELR